MTRYSFSVRVHASGGSEVVLYWLYCEVPPVQRVHKTG